MDSSDPEIIGLVDVKIIEQFEHLHETQQFEEFEHLIIGLVDVEH